MSDNTFAYTSFVEENKKPEEEEKEEDPTEKNVWKDAIDPLGNARAAALRKERLQGLGLVTPSMKVVRKDAERMIDLGKRKESWICTVCTLKNQGSVMRCTGCKAKRVREDPNAAREMCTFEFLACSGGGFSYDIRNCREHYEGAIDMATLRWNEVMQEVKREKHPLSPRSQQLCRSTHPKEGSTLSADQEFKNYGITERELSQDENGRKKKKKKKVTTTTKEEKIDNRVVAFDGGVSTSSDEEEEQEFHDDSAYYQQHQGYGQGYGHQDGYSQQQGYDHHQQQYQQGNEHYYEDGAYENDGGDEYWV